MDKKKGLNKLTKVVSDADKILSTSRKEGVTTPKQFAKVFESTPPSTLSSNEVKAQVAALNDFSDGKMSYSQMRSRCG
jgi:hypothetical protein